ncbi:hypothetical protein D0S45_17730 [Marinifilum sp. JC120]|nr:hypothetical protein D0S45_17730 [Marinifilum sp. JC120]
MGGHHLKTGETTETETAMRKLEAVQFFSSDDISNVRRFIRKIRKYYKSGGIVFSGKKHTKFNDEERLCISFAYLALTQNQTYRWHVENGFEILIDENDARFHQSPECSIFLDLLLGGDNCRNAIKGVSAKREINKLIPPLREAVAKITKIQTEINLSFKKAAEINFWRYEYIKRKFIQDISADNEYAAKIQQLFEGMEKAFKLLDDLEVEHCSECLWRTTERQNYGDWPFIFKDLGCGDKYCSFKIFCSQQTEIGALAKGFHNEDSVPSFMTTMEYIDLHWENYTIDQSVSFDLVEKYGLYPYELFSIASSNLITNILNSDDNFPEREFYSGIILDKQNFKPTKVFAKLSLEKAKRNNVIRQDGTEAKYYSNNRARMIGLFLWDSIHSGQQEKNFSLMDACKKLCSQKWFADKDSEKELCELIHAGHNAYDIQDELKPYNKLYNRTKRCIEEGKVLPFNTAKKNRL